MADGIGMNGVSTPANGAAVAHASMAELPELASKLAPSPLVQRLFQQNAQVHSPGLVQVPAPEVDEQQQISKKPLGPMVPARDLSGGQSPLAPMFLQDARASYELFQSYDPQREALEGFADADAGAGKLPSRHGLVAFTRSPTGQPVYLTQDRMMHIDEGHISSAPAPRGKRNLSYWPVKFAANQPTMTQQDVVGVIMDAARNGHYSNQVRDTRAAHYALPAQQADQYGIANTNVLMAPDGLVLTAIPTAGHNMLMYREVSAEDQAALEALQAQNAAAATTQSDDRMFATNISATTYG